MTGKVMTRCKFCRTEWCIDEELREAYPERDGTWFCWCPKAVEGRMARDLVDKIITATEIEENTSRGWVQFEHGLREICDRAVSQLAGQAQAIVEKIIEKERLK